MKRGRATYIKLWGSVMVLRGHEFVEISADDIGNLQPQNNSNKLTTNWHGVRVHVHRQKSPRSRPFVAAQWLD